MIALSHFIEDALAREQAFLLEAVQDLTPEELVWRATPEANPIGWMLWHMLRVEDMWVQFFTQNQPELWERDSWNQRFGLPVRDNGFGHTPEQVTNFPALDLPELLRYGAAVRASTLDYLRGLQPEDFEVSPRERRPDFSVATMFRQIIGEFYQHTGQIAYVKGLIRGSNAFPSKYTAPG